MSMAFGSRMEHEQEGDHEPMGPAMSRLFMTAGKRDGITAKDIVKTFTAEAGVPFSEIGRISLMDAFTFVEVSKDYAERVIQSIDKIMLKGKQIRIEKARERKRS